MGSADVPDIPPVGDQSFDEFYYGNCCGRPYRRDDEWLAFFGGIADRIVSDLQPARVLDAGCALGLLVEALRERGVEACGLDLSTYAIEHVHASVKPFCRHGSITDPLAERYDLIVCIEVVEHIPAREAEHAIENLCAHAERVLFSSSPLDYREPTHVNVHPTDYWAEQFARQGFYRDVDFDASFITPWAALFRKSGEPIHRLIKAYERRFWEMQSSANGARSYAIELQERVARTEAERDRLSGELVQAHADLRQVHADLGQARTEIVQVHAELNRSHTAAHEQAARYAADRDGLSRQLSSAAQTIANMERSVFWRIRGAYLKIRRMIQPHAS